MSTILRLERYSYTREYTEGRLYTTVTGERAPICWTIERPWQDNKPNVSCIPEGVYDLRQHKRPNGDNVYLIVGNSCCAYPHQLDAEHGITRWGIQIHPANHPDQVEGCIAPGLEQRRGHVLSSRDAMKALHRALVPYFSMNPYGQIEITSEVSVSR